MEDNTTLDILKNAILLERRGMAFYAEVANRTQSSAVKQFFNIMAAEEDKHIHILSDQFKSYQETKTFSPNFYDVTHTSNMASKVLTNDVSEQISAAEFEAAAISAAMAMEKNAIRFYSERAEATTDHEEKSLYRWLAEWEHHHLNFLADIDKELTEKIWYDRNFWPF